MISAWDRYWFREAPLRDLAIVRVVLVTFQLAWMAVSNLDLRIEEHALHGHPEAAPLMLLRLLSWPIGGPGALDLERMRMIVSAAYFAGALGAMGCFTRVSLVVFAWSQWVILSWIYSGGLLIHPEALITIALAALACSPSGAALSIDSRWRRSKGSMSPWAAWPLLLMRWLLVLAYLSAAASKLAASGLDWVNGYTLQYFTFLKGMALDRGTGVWISEQHTLSRLLSAVTLGFELSSPVLLVRPRLAWLWLPIGAAIHTGIYLSVGAPFFQFIALYVVFLPALRKEGRRVATAPAS